MGLILGSRLGIAKTMRVTRLRLRPDGARFINTEPSASVLRPSPTVLTVVVPTSALPRTQYLIDLYFAARYQRFNHDFDSIVEVERAPDHQRAGPARELDL